MSELTICHDCGGRTYAHVPGCEPCWGWDTEDDEFWGDEFSGESVRELVRERNRLLTQGGHRHGIDNGQGTVVELEGYWEKAYWRMVPALLRALVTPVDRCARLCIHVDGCDRAEAWACVFCSNEERAGPCFAHEGKPCMRGIE